ncbi:hypothetical protein PG996_009253 [Apiospora saccharicola]|uniref:Uncharacterized protein n=1 Tax=Apiospora saccharicola TaxID=335842 RepID=A0ABR1UK83_9PEZI
MLLESKAAYSGLVAGNGTGLNKSSVQMLPHLDRAGSLGTGPIEEALAPIQIELRVFELQRKVAQQQC